jgi:hypothetical protein
MDHAVNLFKPRVSVRGHTCILATWGDYAYESERSSATEERRKALTVRVCGAMPRLNSANVCTLFNAASLRYAFESKLS